MSGGRFDYSQWQIKNIQEECIEIAEKIGDKMTKEELKDSFFWLDPDSNDPKERIHYHYLDNTAFKIRLLEAIDALGKAYIYAQRLDWLLSDDDGVDSFHSRLVEELKSHNREHKKLVKRLNKKWNETGNTK